MKKDKCCISNKWSEAINLSSQKLKIIADQNRLKILCILKKGERCACDIAADIDIPQNLASHHLKVLKESGLLISRKEGLEVIYSLQKKELAKFNSLINQTLQIYGK